MWFSGGDTGGDLGSYWMDDHQPHAVASAVFVPRDRENCATPRSPESVLLLECLGGYIVFLRVSS